MSRFQKIFLASALVVTGFFVAKFLGQPIPLPQVLNSPSMLTLPGSPGSKTQVTTGGTRHEAARVRLLPDLSVPVAEAPVTNPGAMVLQPPRLANALSPVLGANESVDSAKGPRGFDSAPIPTAALGESDSPRARLRNEAPRPVGIDPQSPATIRRAPLVNIDVNDPYRVIDTKTEPKKWSAPQLLNSEFAQSGPSTAPAVQASYTAPVNRAAENQFAPPPWPAPGDTTEPRTHIIADGDSLEKIASRYLSDPKRSREIFELNRELLSAPDLLPIGAELKIPQRVASVSWDRRGFEPNSAIPRSTSNSGPETMSSARPASSSQGIIPRAQLAPPVMVQ